MPPDLLLPDFGDPPAPSDDWLSAGLADLPVPDLPDFPVFDAVLSPPAAAALPRLAPALSVTPPPRRVLDRPVFAATPPSPPAPGEREFPTQVVRDDDPATILWQLTVASDQPWDDVRVRFAVPDGMPPARITHKPTVTRRQVSWSLGTVETGRPVALQIRFPAAVSPELANAPPPFQVSFTPRAAARLAVRATVAARVRHGQPVELRAEVSNLGAVAARDVEVVALTDGCPVSRAAVPLVAAGSPVEVVLSVPAPSAAGLARWDVRATATGIDAAIASAETAVSAPLTVAVIAPDRIELDAECAVAVRVENQSPVARAGGRVTLRLPIELQLGASDGRVNRASAEVTWDVPVWEPHEVREFAATATGCLPGRFAVDAEIEDEDGTRTATASGECALVRSRDSTALADWLREQAVPDADEERTTAAAAQSGERHVVFRLGAQTYASPIRQLREVVRLPAVTPVPGTPDWLLGVANVRGDVLSVIDFPTAVGVPAEPAARRSLLVTAATAVGLTVDEVLGIRRCAPTPWTTDDRREAGTIGDFLTGLFEYDRRLTPVLDLDQVLSSGLLTVAPV